MSPTPTQLVLLAASLAAGTVLCSPIAAPEAPLTVVPVSVAPGVYLCEYPNWTGACVWQGITPTPAAPKGCFNFPWGQNWDYHWSFGPDPGLACTLFAEPDCSDTGGLVGDLKFPGVSDVSHVQGIGGLGGAPGSINCNILQGYPGFELQQQLLNL